MQLISIWGWLRQNQGEVGPAGHARVFTSSSLPLPFEWCFFINFFSASSWTRPLVSIISGSLWLSRSLHAKQTLLISVFISTFLLMIYFICNPNIFLMRHKICSVSSLHKCQIIQWWSPTSIQTSNRAEQNMAESIISIVILWSIWRAILGHMDSITGLPLVRWEVSARLMT